MERTYSKNKKILWIGAPTQHFRYNTTYWSGEWRPPPRFVKDDELYGHCRPILKFPYGHPYYDPLNQFAFNTAIKYSFPASWINLGKGSEVCIPREEEKFHLYFLPTYEIFVPFYGNHITSYDEVAYDCTHYCLIPHLDDPIWHAWYILVNVTACSDHPPRFKPGPNEVSKHLDHGKMEIHKQFRNNRNSSLLARIIDDIKHLLP